MSTSYIFLDYALKDIHFRSATGSFLATPTDSQATFTPTFAFPSSASPASTSPTSHKLRQPVGTIIGETFAALFGILLFGLGALSAWQWRKRRRNDAERRVRTMRVQAASQILAGADQYRPAGSNPPLPVQAVLSEGIDSASRSESYGSIVPRVVPFPSDSLGRSTRRSDPLPHHIRARERASSAFTMFTGGGASSALAEDGHSGVGATHSRGASASF